LLILGYSTSVVVGVDGCWVSSVFRCYFPPGRGTFIHHTCLVVTRSMLMTYFETCKSLVDLIYCFVSTFSFPVRHALGCRGVGPVDISLVDTFSQSLGMLFKSNRFACNKFVLTLKLIATTSNARVGATQKYSLGECCQALNSYTSLTLHGHPT